MNKYVLIPPDELVELLSAVVKKELQSILNPETIRHDSPEKEEYLTRHETAKFLRCSLTTLYYYEQHDKLIPLRIGRKVLYPKSKVLAAMQSNGNTRGP